MENIEDRHRKIVAKIMKPLVSEPATQSIFILWPNLVGITERFCNFVSPLMPSSKGDPLVTHAIQSAIRAYRIEKDDGLKGRAYVVGLIEAASSLSEFTVQGVKDDIVITWEPFMEPMLSWMVKNKIVTIRTSKSSGDVTPLAAKRAVLVHILSAQDMERMGLSTLPY